ncbi:hypothetical protein [Amantichitinum ursilacus]|uniref:PIN domain-containing protein n=1 Tax=Amantichitinum ursilacus TaxID=857265 RepID=A0A0N0XKQ9_9NEIS|nr:hypothetical protein [Amantichitinum ursilacus]KPC53047.1 hypothetical protein WG78_11170 [Amantichitinum ursilacus]
MSEITSYMLDTNIFCAIVAGEFHDLPDDGRYFATHIQRDELGNTKSDADLRDRLLSLFAETIEKPISTAGLMAGISVAGGSAPDSGERLVPTEAAIWDTSTWGESKFDDTSGQIEMLLGRMKEKDGRAKKLSSHAKDVLILATAIRNGFHLLTGDVVLFELAQECGALATLIQYAAPKQQP